MKPNEQSKPPDTEQDLEPTADDQDLQEPYREAFPPIRQRHPDLVAYLDEAMAKWRPEQG